MKRIIIIAGTGVIVVVAIGTALASAFSGRSGAYGLNTSASSMMPGSARSLYQLEVAALTSQGISQARAVEALNVQNEVWKADLVHKVEAALGNSYAGMWFEPARAEQHIGVTSTAARHTAARVVMQAGLTDHVVETPVRSTWGELEAALKQWKQRLTSLPQHGETAIGLTAQGNALAITLGPSVPAAEHAALTHEAAHAAVNVNVTVSPHPLAFTPYSASSECNAFTTDEAFCEKTLTSGVSIAIGPETKQILCTAGPMVIPRASKGERYLLTAGHCIGSYGSTTITRSKWYAFNTKKEGKEVGPALEFINATKGDVGLIQINNFQNSGYWVESGADPVTASTAEWGTKRPEVKWVVAGERAPMTGNTSCHEGQTSGQSCGIVSKTMTTIVTSGTKEELTEVKGTELRGEEGDSGGPFLEILTKSNNEAVMEGTLVGGAETGPLYYEPLSKIYSLLPRNLELLTKGNENQAATPSISPIGSFSDKSGATKLIGKSVFGGRSEVTCSSSTSTGGLKTALLGTFDMLFSTCLVNEIELLLCTGLSSTQTSSILVLGTFHLRYLGPPKKTAVIAYLIIPVHFSCVGSLVTVLIEVRGCAAGQIGPVNIKVKSSEHFVATLKKVSGTTRNEITKIMNEAGTAEETCALESKEGTGAFESSAEEMTDEITPNAESEIIA
jgi:hypothetical protein